MNDGVSAETTQITIRERLAPPTKRGFAYYLDHMQISPEDLNGKTVLNLAAGGDDLEKDLKRRGVGVKVFNFDLKYPRKIFGNDYTPQNPVKVDIKRLSQADETVDIVVSSEGLTRWLEPKDQPSAAIEALRVLKEGGTAYFFEFRWDMSTNAKKFITEVRSAYPNIEVVYDKPRKTVKMAKTETYCPFEGQVDNPQISLEQIKDSGIRSHLVEVIKFGQQNRDLLDINDRYKLNTFVQAILDPLVRGEGDPGDWDSVKKILATCVDAGKEIGNNSIFDHARYLTADVALVHPNDSMGPNLDTKTLEAISTINRDRVSLDDKLRAFQESWRSESWSGNEANKRILDDLSKSGDRVAWEMATKYLKKNVLTLTDDERVKIAEYFEELVDSANSTRLEQFRALGWEYQGDPILSQFSRMHDPSIYGAAEYWSSSRMKGPIQAMNLLLSGNKRMGERVYAGKVVEASYQNDATPLDYAKEIIKLVRTPADQLLLRQEVARANCPSCYGYSEGFNAQRKIQSGEFMETKEYFDPKRVEFAVELAEI